VLVPDQNSSRACLSLSDSVATHSQNHTMTHDAGEHLSQPAEYMTR
jgi:hypothetical protein